MCHTRCGVVTGVQTCALPIVRRFWMPKDCNMIIGLYYETSSGAVARTTGWDGRSCEVLYHFDDGQGSRRASEAEVASWMPHHELDDFPHTREHQLPSPFAIFWEIKTSWALRWQRLR